VQPARSTGGGFWNAMLVGFFVIVLVAVAAYFVIGRGLPSNAPTAPQGTSAPATVGPATAAPVMSAAPPPRYP
jgi:hypothetical protein